MANPGITAKFPGALVSLTTDFGGSFPSLAAPTTLTLNTALLATDHSVVATANIPTSWPSTGWIVIDSEVLHYDSYATATFTITPAAPGPDGRGSQGTTAATHAANASIGMWLTTQQVNQMMAEIIATQTKIGTGASTPSGTTNVLTATGTGTSAWAALPASSITTASADLSGDVSITPANTWVDGPSVSLAAGTWFIAAQGLLQNTAQNSMHIRLYNSTDAAVIADAESYVTGAVWTNLSCFDLLVIAGTKTVKLQAASDLAGGACTLKAAVANPTSGGNIATRIIALKVA